jgi:hypothetical protein
MSVNVIQFQSINPEDANDRCIAGMKNVPAHTDKPVGVVKFRYSFHGKAQNWDPKEPYLCVASCSLQNHLHLPIFMFSQMSQLTLSPLATISSLLLYAVLEPMNHSSLLLLVPHKSTSFRPCCLPSKYCKVLLYTQCL